MYNDFRLSALRHTVQQEKIRLWVGVSHRLFQKTLEHAFWAWDLVASEIVIFADQPFEMRPNSIV
jgi:hypothetical protein